MAKPRHPSSDLSLYEATELLIALVAIHDPVIGDLSTRKRNALVRQVTEEHSDALEEIIREFLERASED